MEKRCSVDGCESIAMARGWCGKHYDRWRRHGDPTVVRSAGTCSEDGCGRSTVGQGWCELHYGRYVRSPQRKARRLEAKASRLCAHCGQLIPPERNARAVFCSRECKELEHIASGKQRESMLRAYYRRAYGLTLEQVEEMRRSPCAICGVADGVGRHGQLNIDHCHKTGVIRGVLCSECNTGLGKFKDDPARLEAAIRYLAK